jgi:glycosyltransferase involved in cell wall biosynthesis
VTVTSVEDVFAVPVEQLCAQWFPEDLITMLVAQLLALRSVDAAGPIMHLPATSWAIGDLSGLIAPLADAPVLLSPRLAADPPADGLEPSVPTLERRGRIAADLIVVDASARARAFLDWWTTRCEQSLGGLDRQLRGRRRPRYHWLYRSLELAAARPGVGLLADPGLGLSAWNIAEHRLTEVDGTVRLDGGATLRLLDLPGFSPDRPWQLNRTATRAAFTRSSPVAALTLRYGAALREAGWQAPVDAGAIGRPMPEGPTFDPSLAELYGVAVAAGTDLPDPLTPAGAQAFIAWLAGPAVRGSAHGVNRYVFHRVLSDRADVVDAFPDLDGQGGIGLVRWCETSGAELGIPDSLMPTPQAIPAPAAPAALAAPPAPPATAAPPGPPVTAAPGVAAGPASPAALSATLLATAVSDAPAVRVHGYLGHLLGLGAAARGYARALEAAEVPVSTLSLSLDHLQSPTVVQAGYGRHAFEDISHQGQHGFELICVNPDELERFVETLGPASFSGRRIGVWGWETNRIPDRWAPAFAFVDEIWVYSRFVAENLAPVSPVPVIALPPPVSAPQQLPEPDRLGLPENFIFLFAFDYSSTLQRKNPVGLIEAFKRAFGEGSGPQLLIKTLNAPRLPLDAAEVMWATEGRRDIHVIDRSLTAVQRDALMLACDCYVSLHRSEGFGLTLAEAMAVGKPVLATRYSGNTDFMNDANSYLVDYELTEVGAGVAIYPADGEWAEPSIEHAAQLMRQIYADPEAAARVGARAREDIARELSPAATGAAMRRRLEALADG